MEVGEEEPENSPSIEPETAGISALVEVDENMLKRSVLAESKLSKSSRVRTPMVKKTKYEGEDQMNFGELRTGEIFNHLPYVYPQEVKDHITCPFTIKTNEKTKLLIIEKDGISKNVRDYLIEEFQSKYRFMK